MRFTGWSACRERLGVLERASVDRASSGEDSGSGLVRTSGCEGGGTVGTVEEEGEEVLIASGEDWSCAVSGSFRFLLLEIPISVPGLLGSFAIVAEG